MSKTRKVERSFDRIDDALGLGGQGHVHGSDRGQERDGEFVEPGSG